MTAQAHFYAAASLASFASCALHAFGGGALMARPFYRKALAQGVSTHAFRYCWHFVTAALIAMGAGFAFLAVEPQHLPLGVHLTLSAVMFSGLSIAVSQIECAPALKSPPTTLCAIIAALGFSAILAG